MRRLRVRRKDGALMAISTRTRFEILKRDGFRCRYCGADPTKCVLHVDHVLAIANGGTDEFVEQAPVVEAAEG